MADDACLLRPPYLYSMTPHCKYTFVQCNLAIASNVLQCPGCDGCLIQGLQLQHVPPTFPSFTGLYIMHIVVDARPGKYSCLRATQQGGQGNTCDCENQL